jgi:hypothetical protein
MSTGNQSLAFRGTGSNNRRILFKASKKVGQDHACLPAATDLRSYSVYPHKRVCHLCLFIRGAFNRPVENSVRSILVLTSSMIT